jgi:hypothetical protein
MNKDLALIKELVLDLESSNIHYLVFAGWALDAKRGRVTRPHEDLDVYCLRSEFSKIKGILEKLGYKLVDKINDLHAFKKEGLKVDFCLLEEERGNLVTAVRFVKISFPKELFFNPQRGKIEDVEFNIPPNEILKADGLKSKKGTDAEFAKTLSVDESMNRKIKEVKI